MTTLASHGDCIIGIDRGEFGGELRVVHAGVSKTLVSEYWMRAERLVSIGDDVWVLTDDPGLASPRATVTQIHFDARAGCSARTLDRLSGAPVAFGVEAGKRLLILVPDAAQSCPGQNGMQVLAVGPDGRIESLP